ncbi:MAG: MFS transporter [Bacteroidales bacterium]|nr:MFS transporter [Bacteroidales bacterium]
MSAKNLNWIAIGTMWALFGMISFVTNIAAPLGNIWSSQYEWAGMAGNLMNFAAYLFMGVPAGAMLVRFGYKRTLLMALGVGALGMGTQLLSGYAGADTEVMQVAGKAVCLNLIIYLLGALICGFCVCMLNTCVNPMTNLLGGGGNRGYQLIQAGGIINSLSGAAAPLAAGALIGTLTERTTISEVAPICLVALGIFVVALVIISFIRIDEPQGNLADEHFEHSPLHFSHFRLGIIAIFCSVGIEVGIPGELNAWISHMAGQDGSVMEGSAQVAGTMASIYWIIMMVGRLAATVLSGRFSPRAQLSTASIVAIVLLTAALCTEQVTWSIGQVQLPLSCIFIVLCGLCTAILWAAVFNLATEGLGKYTAQASGIFMTMVVGGGIIPMVQDSVLRPWLGYLESYLLIIALFVYILYYSIRGSRIIQHTDD